MRVVEWYLSEAADSLIPEIEVGKDILSFDFAGCRGWSRLGRSSGVAEQRRLGHLWSWSPDSMGIASDQLIDGRGSPCLDDRGRKAIIDSQAYLLICSPLLDFCHSAIADEVHQQRHIEQRSEGFRNQYRSCWKHSCHFRRRRTHVELALNIHFHQMIGSTEMMSCQRSTLRRNCPDQKPFGGALWPSHNFEFEHPHFDLSSIDVQLSYLNQT